MYYSFIVINISNIVKYKSDLLWLKNKAQGRWIRIPLPKIRNCCTHIITVDLLAVLKYCTYIYAYTSSHVFDFYTIRLYVCIMYMLCSTNVRTNHDVTVIIKKIIIIITFNCVVYRCIHTAVDISVKATRVYYNNMMAYMYII